MENIVAHSWEVGPSAANCPSLERGNVNIPHTTGHLESSPKL